MNIQRYDAMKNRISALVMALTMLLASACTAIDDEPPYTVISKGTTVPVPSASSSPSDDAPEEKLIIPDNMETRYFSLSYNVRMQNVYDSVVDTITSFSDNALLPLTISRQSYTQVLETVHCEQLAFFFLDTRTLGEFNSAAQTFEINFRYKYSVEEVNRMLAETEQKALEITEQTRDFVSDYDKAKYFHDYLVTHVESAEDYELADSVYGTLIGGKALCEGYAKTFSYLCNIAGIENMLVTGYTDIDHMWNMVKLDGKWYHVDIGWDQPAAAIKNSYPDMVLYRYFLTDDDTILQTRTISNSMGVPPKAESRDMNYFVKHGLTADTYEEALEIIEKSCRLAMDSGEAYFSIELSDDELYRQTIEELMEKDADGVSDIDRLMTALNFRGNISYIDYYADTRILIFILDTGA